MDPATIIGVFVAFVALFVGTIEGRSANRRVEIMVHTITLDPEPTFGEGA